MHDIQHRKPPNPIVAEISSLNLSREARELALRHYQIATTLIEILWTAMRALARIPYVVGLVMR
jgi:hypothetical protein